MDVRCLAVQPNKGWRAGDAAVRSSLGKGDLSKTKDNAGAEPMHTKWSRVNLGWKENEPQKLCSSGKGFQEEL